MPKVSQAELHAVVKKFEEFSGKEAVEARAVELPDPPKVSVILGQLTEVVYRISKGGGKNKTDYVHRFKKPLPLLLTNEDGTALFIAEGRFFIDDRGIVG